jgi:hypothetical protein
MSSTEPSRWDPSQENNRTEGWPGPLESGAHSARGYGKPFPYKAFHQLAGVMMGLRLNPPCRSSVAGIVQTITIAILCLTNLKFKVTR